MPFFIFGVLVTLLALNIHSLPTVNQGQSSMSGSSSDVSNELPIANRATLEKAVSENGPNPDIAGENEETVDDEPMPSEEVKEDDEDEDEDVPMPTNYEKDDEEDKDEDVPMPANIRHAANSATLEQALSDPNPDIAGKNEENDNDGPAPVADTQQAFTGFESDNIEEMKLSSEDVNIYLIRYGYLKTPANNSISMQDTEVAIRTFQQFANLKQTGVMDTATQNLMKSPRCGMVDRSPDENVNNFKIDKRFMWKKQNLTYRIAKFTKRLTIKEVRSTFRKAFDMWSAVTPLRFTEIYSGTADIMITFGGGNHGDKYPFDGKGGVLAHAYFPQNGDAHYDDDESWTVKSRRGTNLLYVALHEFGHSLGLFHSNVAGAVMKPFYGGYDPNLKLKADDIKGIQTLYGKHRATTPKPSPATTTIIPTTTEITRGPTTTMTVPTVEPPITTPFPCPFRLMAIIFKNNTYYIFRNKRIYTRVNGTSKLYGRTKWIYAGGPDVVTAAAHDSNTNQTFLFSDLLAYRYTNDILDIGYPKLIDYYMYAAVIFKKFFIGFTMKEMLYIDRDLTEFIPAATGQEFINVPRVVSGAVTFDNENIDLFHRKNVYRMNFYTGKVTEWTCRKPR